VQLRNSERIKTKFDEITEYTVVVLSRNHERFIFDCLSSINRELWDAKVVCADIGSSDATLSLGKQIASEFGLKSQHVQFSNDTKTLTVLKNLEVYIETKFAILISADDALGENYRIALNNIQKINPHESVINFTSLLTDENLVVIGSKEPCWRETAQKNRNLLSFSNPGTAPGAVIPWKTLTKQDSWKNPPKILIEDYWIWWQLVDLVPFINCTEAQVLYRQHEYNISKARKNKDYAYSLGLITAIPNIRADSLCNKIRSLLLILRWIRHLNLIVWPIFVKGYSTTKKTGILA